MPHHAIAGRGPAEVVPEPAGRRRSRLALAGLMVTTGVLHFVVVEPYVRILPRFLPAGWARPVVLTSGAAEVAGGLALLPRSTRRWAGLFLAGLLVVVFPANVQMAVDRPNAFTLLRLPLQAPLVWWAWRQARHPTGQVGAPTRSTASARSRL